MKPITVLTVTLLFAFVMSALMPSGVSAANDVEDGVEEGDGDGAGDGSGGVDGADSGNDNEEEKEDQCKGCQAKEVEKEEKEDEAGEGEVSDEESTNTEYVCRRGDEECSGCSLKPTPEDSEKSSCQPDNPKASDLEKDPESRRRK